jgi:hypothetical protein
MAQRLGGSAAHPRSQARIPPTQHRNAEVPARHRVLAVVFTAAKYWSLIARPPSPAGPSMRNSSNRPSAASSWVGLANSSAESSSLGTDPALVYAVSDWIDPVGLLPFMLSTPLGDAGPALGASQDGAQRIGAIALIARPHGPRTLWRLM